MVRPDALLAAGGLLLGAGLGGFVDGIVLHQVLQWHHMFSAHPDPAIADDMRLNVMADGFFHVATWLMTTIGLALVVRAFRGGARITRKGLAGAALVGAGVFHLVEGIVDHHILGIHHVHPSGALIWDLAFLALGAVLVVVGYGLWQSGSARAPRVQASAAG